MENHEQFSNLVDQEVKSLPPHSYPFLFRYVAVLLLVTLFYGFCQLFYYSKIGDKLERAERAFQIGDYDDAVKRYEALHEQFHSIKKIRMRLAQSYFALQDFSTGFNYVLGLNLAKSEFEEINRYLPEEQRIQA